MYSPVVYFTPGQTILFKTGDLTDRGPCNRYQFSIHWGVPNVDPTDEVLFFQGVPWIQL